MLRHPVTAALLVAALAPTATAGAEPYSKPGFYRSPSGELSCDIGNLTEGGEVTASFVQCSNRELASRSRFVELRDGGRARVTVGAVVRGGRVLAYGHHTHLSGLDCFSSRKGFRCVNLSSHGFRISAAGVSRF